MNASIHQILNTPSPSGIPGGTAKLPSGTAGFENFLDTAMKKGSDPKRQKLPQPPASKLARKPEGHKKSSPAGIIAQTPVALPAASRPAGNSPANATQAQAVGISKALTKDSQLPSRGVQVLEALVARQFQSEAAETSPRSGKSQGTPSQRVDRQVGNNGILIQDNQQNNGNNLPVNPSPAPLQTDEEKATSVKAQPLPSVASQAVQIRGMLLGALGPVMKGPSGRAADAAPVPRPGNEPLQIPAPIKTQPPERHAIQVQAPGKQDKPLQEAMTAMENLQLNFFSRAATANTAPLPNGLTATPPSSVHGMGGHTSADSAQLKQQATALQNQGKDAGGSSAVAGQNAGKEFPVNATASGSSGDAPKDGKHGQDRSSNHAEVSGSQGPGAGTATGGFNSVAASTGATSAAPFTVAPAQTAPGNAGTANPTAPTQPGAAHTPVADKMATVVENPLNPVGGDVNTASLLQRQGKTEMRVAMQTDNLGPLELHAVLDGGRLGASIAVVNHEAHTLLTNNLPSLQQVLNDQNLRVDHLSVLNASTSTGTNTGNGGGFQSGGHSHSYPNAPQWGFSHPAPAVMGSKESPAVETLRGRLSVRA